MTPTLLGASEWAQVEFGPADLGDARRTKRLVRVAATLAAEAHGTLPESFDHWAELKAAYRLLEEPEVTYEKLIAPHCARVRREWAQVAEGLLVEDTSELNFTGHPATVGLGRINDDTGRGLYVHSALALAVERWAAEQEPEVTVLGLLGQTVWARTRPTIGQGREPRRKRMTRDRESERWAAVLEEIGGPPARTRWTFLADRESDIYETFVRCQIFQWDFIIRAHQPRALADEGGSVFEAVARAPLRGRFRLPLRSRPEQVKRPKRKGQKRHVSRPKLPSRTVRLEVRTCTVTLRGPYRPGGKAAPLTVNVVEAKELHPPAGCEPVHWVLLTTWPVETFQQALRVIKAYTCRWLIEEYHKALKTGTGIERSQLTTAGRITALLGILAVEAVRLLSRKLLGTTRPEDPVSAAEVGPEVLAILEAKYGRPVEGWTNRTVLSAIAQLGGFPGRRGDGPPGWITLWRGWRKLTLLVHGFDLARGEKCG